MNESELRELRVILNALANQNGLLQWVNCYAVGRNEGGLYLSLFNDKLQYRVCTVYQERFRELPPFIRDNIPDDAIEISTDRTVVERKGQLRPCTPFQIARYAVGEGDKAAWKFGGVVRVSKPRQEETQPAPATTPAPAQPTTRPALTFATKEDAIHYGVQRNVYANYAAAEVAYTALKDALQPASSAEMFAAWVGQVEGIVATQRDFETQGQSKPSPPPAQGKTAGQRVRERIAGQPGYAG